MHPLAPLGKTIFNIGLVASIVLGLMSKPALASIFAGSLALTIGYVILRLPELWWSYRSGGAKLLRLTVYLLLGTSLFSAILYGIGLGISRIFQ